MPITDSPSTCTGRSHHPSHTCNTKLNIEQGTQEYDSDTIAGTQDVDNGVYAHAITAHADSPARAGPPPSTDTHAVLVSLATDQNDTASVNHPPTGSFTINLRDCHETYTREGLSCSTENQPLKTQIRRLLLLLLSTFRTFSTSLCSKKNGQII